MYKEDDYTISVQEALHQGDSPGDFQKRIADLVNRQPELWKDFSQTVAQDVSVRAQNLKTRIFSSV
jgi:hypothetical protein